MRFIEKGYEPREWSKHKSTPSATYAGADTEKLRLALLEEQGYLCAYCMKRIVHVSRTDTAAKPTTTRIEHIKCQTVNGKEDTSRSLDYSNMVLCCDGGESLGKAWYQCDKLKEDDGISFSPLDLNIVNMFSFKGDGSMKAITTQLQEQIGSDTDEKQKGILNLNNRILKRNRKVVLDALLIYLNKEGWTDPVFKKTRKQWFERDSNGTFKEYSQVVIAYLDKRLERP